TRPSSGPSSRPWPKARDSPRESCGVSWLKEAAMPTAYLPTGIDLYYESHGEGEPLVLIPSTAFPADVWLPDQVPALSRELRLILLDVRGVGRSTHYQGVYTIEQMACDVIALLDHLDVPAAHLLGHSMGGRIALEAALDWPGRVKSLIMAASG